MRFINKESVAWDNDTLKLENAECFIIQNEVTEDNYFLLFVSVSDVEDRTSLCSDEKYIERMIYCKKLNDMLYPLK